MSTPITDAAVMRAGDCFESDPVVYAWKVRTLELDRAALMESIEEYFIAYANKDKKPGWIGRITEAKAKINDALSTARANFP